MAIKTLFVTGLLDADTTDLDQVGSIRHGDQGEVYRYIKNHSATAILQHQPVCYDAGKVSTKALYDSVESPVSADLMLNAGIAMTGLAISGGICFGWVQVEGYHADALVTSPNTTAGGITAAIGPGSELICVNAATSLVHSVAAGTAPVYSSHMIAQQVLAAATPTAVSAIDVMIRCL